MRLDILLQPIAMRRDLHIQFEQLLAEYIIDDAVVYDIGCGQKPFAESLKGKASSHIGVDLIDGFYKPDQVDLIGTAYDVPAPELSADAIILSQVIEHLSAPLLAIKEAHRLLKPGGVLFLSFPFLYPQHAQPYDYLRFTEYYLESEIAKEDFEILVCNRIGGFWYMLGMYMGMYFQQIDRGIMRKLFLAKIISSIIGFLFLLLHKTEEITLRIIRKDVDQLRARWTVNYVAVLRKKV